jgi:hypothetical protein
LSKFAYFLLISICLVLLVVAGTPIISKAAPQIPSMKLRSRLEADYQLESFADHLSPLRISIVSDVYQDQVLSVEEIAAIENRLIESLQSPVPTATARDFEGSLPFTATATNTNTPTSTSTSTPTSTPTRTPLPTRTPTKTNTKPPPKPTKKPETPTITLTPSDTPTPTLSPTPIVDLDDPLIKLTHLSGAGGCTVTIGFDVEDPEPSLGVKDSNVELKFENPKGSGSYFYPSLTGGGNWQGAPGTKWVGSYSGSQSGISPDSEIKVWVSVTDNAGHSVSALGIVLEIDSNCNPLQQ